MLKYLAKVFFVGVLSGSLLLLDFSPNTSNVFSSAMAQEQYSSSEIKDGNLTSTLTMVGIGYVASRLLTCAKTSLDMGIATAAGVAFLAGDVLSFIKLRDVLEKMKVDITRDKNGKIYDEQSKTLKDLKKSYEEAKKTAKIKKMLQQTALAAFGIATALAVTQYLSNNTAYATCQTGITSGIASCNASAAACSAAAGSCSGPFLAGAAALGTSIGILAAMKTVENVPNASLAVEVEDKSVTTSLASSFAAATGCPQGMAIAKGACAGLITLKETNKGYCTPVTVARIFDLKQWLYNESPALHASNSMAEESVFAKMIKHLFINDANASFAGMGITGMGAGFLLSLIPSLGSWVDTQLFSPLNRAKVWGALAMMTMSSISAVDGVIDELDGNIAKINNILDPVMEVGTGTQVGNAINAKVGNEKEAQKNNDLKIDADKYEDIVLSNDDGTTIPCLTGGDGKNCPSIESRVTSHPAFKGLDAQSQKDISDLLRNVDGINGKSTISGGTLSNLSKFASNANALSRKGLAEKEKLREKLKKEFKKDVLGQEEKEMANRISGIVNDHLKKSGSSARQMYASLYGGNLDNLDQKDATKAVDQPAVGVVDLGNTDKKAKDEDEKAKLAKASLEEGFESDSDSSVSDSSEYVLNDINKDTSASIFELISNRYQRSGLQRLFRVREVRTDAPANSKN